MTATPAPQPMSIGSTAYLLATEESTPWEVVMVTHHDDGRREYQLRSGGQLIERYERELVATDGLDAPGTAYLDPATGIVYRLRYFMRAWIGEGPVIPTYGVQLRGGATTTVDGLPEGVVTIWSPAADALDDLLGTLVSAKLDPDVAGPRLRAAREYAHWHIGDRWLANNMLRAFASPGDAMERLRAEGMER